MRIMLLAATMVLVFTGCSPEIGSDRWCATMKEKPNGEWTLSETKEFAKNCVFK
jgi:hypothetical protein